jgi:tetratricopeptide (TPR) repeat protein
LLNEGKIQEGIAELKRAIVLDPQNVNLYIDLARAYVHIKDYGSAESVLQQALQANPQSLEARFALGDLHLFSRKADLAESEYKRALNDAPDRPEPRVKLAGFYASVNRLGDAEATYSAWAQCSLGGLGRLLSSHRPTRQSGSHLPKGACRQSEIDGGAGSADCHTHRHSQAR